MHLKPLLTLLTWYAGYTFDDTDWQTIELGLEGTGDHEDRWYSYPLVGHHHLNALMAKAVGCEVVSVRIEGLTEQDLALRAETLLDAYRPDLPSRGLGTTGGV